MEQCIMMFLSLQLRDKYPEGPLRGCWPAHQIRGCPVGEFKVILSKMRVWKLSQREMEAIALSAAL